MSVHLKHVLLACSVVPACVVFLFVCLVWWTQQRTEVLTADLWSKLWCRFTHGTLGVFFKLLFTLKTQTLPFYSSVLNWHSSGRMTMLRYTHAFMRTHTHLQTLFLTVWLEWRRILTDSVDAAVMTSYVIYYCSHNIILRMHAHTKITSYTKCTVGGENRTETSHPLRTGRKHGTRPRSRLAVREHHSPHKQNRP